MLYGCGGVEVPLLGGNAYSINLIDLIVFILAFSSFSCFKSFFWLGLLFGARETSYFPTQKRLI